MHVAGINIINDFFYLKLYNNNKNQPPNLYHHTYINIMGKEKQTKLLLSEILKNKTTNSVKQKKFNSQQEIRAHGATDLLPQDTSFIAQHGNSAIPATSHHLRGP